MNMDKYIPEEYNKVIQMLKPVIEKYDLDSITVESLVRTSLVIESGEYTAALVCWKDREGQVYSTKPSNIKVNLNFALSTAFRLKAAIYAKDIWLSLSILYLVVGLFTDATKKVDEISSLVLLSVYRLEEAEAEHIFEYSSKINPDDSGIQLTKETCIKALNNLEDLKCIKLENGNIVYRSL